MTATRHRRQLRIRTGHRPNAFFGLFLFCVLSLFALAASAQEPCLKQVFGRYCLGGDLAAIASQAPPLMRQEEGERVALIYQDGPERIYVLAWRGLVYKVVRSYRVSTQLRYDELYQLLRSKYGEGEDRSRFPDHAKTPGRKQIAIRRGEGRAAHLWTPAPTWSLELSWTREMGLSLEYVATELSAQQAGAAQSGY